MSNTVNSGAGVLPVNEPIAQPAASTRLPVPEGQRADILPQDTIHNPPATPAMRSADSEVRKANPASEGTSIAVPTEDAKPRAADPVEAPPVANRPGFQLGEPAAPAINQVSSQIAPPFGKEETQVGGNQPPRRPPVDAISSSPEEPEPNKKGARPPSLDIEEFIREVEETKRGAKTKRQIISLGDDIKELANRGVPIGKIYDGLKRRNLVSCSRSRFGEICAELFPELFDSAGRRNA